MCCVQRIHLKTTYFWDLPGSTWSLWRVRYKRIMRFYCLNVFWGFKPFKSFKTFCWAPEAELPNSSNTIDIDMNLWMRYYHGGVDTFASLLVRLFYQKVNLPAQKLLLSCTCTSTSTHRPKLPLAEETSVKADESSCF